MLSPLFLTRLLAIARCWFSLQIGGGNPQYGAFHEGAVVLALIKACNLSP